jgi:hypothetical protein
MALAETASIDDLRRLGVTGIRTNDRQLVDGRGVDQRVVERFRSQWEPFVDAGFRLQLVSPFPGDLTATPYDDPGWRNAWRAIGEDLGRSLGDLVDQWQVGNELNLWQFRAPLPTVSEAATFVEALGTGLRAAGHASTLGINTFGIDGGARELCDRLYDGNVEIDLDFIGLDAYFGSWVAGGPSNWTTAVDQAWELGRGRPVAVCEIGYPSRGGVSDPSELDALLTELGYTDAASVERDRGRLLARIPPRLARSLEVLPAASWPDDFEDAMCHVLQKWRYSMDAGPQTAEKQAAYFRESLPILFSDPRVSDIWLFIYKDLGECWTCGVADCPLETSWGFVEMDGRPKPVVSVVAELLGAPSIVADPA